MTWNGHSCGSAPRLPQQPLVGDRSRLSRKWATVGATGDKLGEKDEIAFRPADAGDQATSLAAFPGAAKVTELQLADRRGRRGWVYLASYAANPPPPASRVDVRYDPVADAAISDYYAARLRPGRADITLSGLQLRIGDGAEILDRIKVRLYIDPVVGSAEEYNEDNYKSALAGFKAGPVRAIRIAEHNLHLGPMIDVRLQTITTFAREHMTMAARLYVPVTAGPLVHKIYLRVGPDLTSANAGVQFYPSRQTPVTIDGRMDAAERALSVNEPTWMAWTGHRATVFYLGRVVPPNHLPTTLYYLDDARANVGPDQEPGAWGQAMYEFDLRSLKKGFINYFYSIVLYPGAYHAGQEEAARETAAPALQVSARELEAEQ